MTYHQEPRPAQFGYPPQQYPGQHPARPHQSHPGLTPERSNNKKIPTWAKVTAGGLAITAAIGGGLAAKANFDSADRAEAGYSLSDEPSHESRPDGLTADTATLEQFTSDEYFTDAERVAWADEQLNAPSTDPEYPNMTVEQAAYKRINANLYKSNGLQLGKEFSALVEPSVNNTPAEVDTQIYVDTAAAMFEPNLDKAKKMLAAVADNNSEFYKNISHDMEKFRAKNPSSEDFYGQTLAYYYTPWDENSTELIPQATGVSDSADHPLGTISPVDNTPTRVSMQRASQDVVRAKNPDFEVVRSFVDGKRWIERESIDRNDVGRWIPPEQLITIQVK